MIARLDPIRLHFVYAKSQPDGNQSGSNIRALIQGRAMTGIPAFN
jgi:hypothetical protein